MNAGACHLARGEQARNGRTSIQIGPHSAHDVVGRGTDRNAIARKIQPRASASLGNEREPRVDEVGIESLQRQEHRLARSTALADDRPRDAITGRQIAGRFVSRHERFGGGVHQPGAFPTQRFG